MTTPPTLDFHFVYIDPALGPDWLFVAARRYWARFRPIVVNDLTLIDYVPKRQRIAITILARRDLAPTLIADIRKRFPNAQHDPLVYDVPEELRLTLDGRATLEQRFGVPEPSGN